MYMMPRNSRALLTALAALALIGCQSEQHGVADDDIATSASVRETKSAARFMPTTDIPDPAGAATGKPSAPVTIRYKISDTPIIGQPLDIELQFLTAATDRPIQVEYRLADASTLTLQVDQERKFKLTMNASSKMGSHKVTVVPQIEGRSYLIVSATVETTRGSMTKQMSVPIQVGAGGPVLQTNGKLLPAADGTTVISVPAKED